MKITTLAGLSRWCPITIALIVLGLPLPAMALPPLQIDDQHQVTGTVTDSNGEPLGGVNIVVSGKGKGTISGFDGSYTLTAIPQDTLVYSFVGFKTRKESVGERLTIHVVLQEDVMALGEVTVNAGYYTVKERERTGSISRIRAEDIGKQPVSNPLAAMQGRMPGVYIQQNTGVPGGGFQIQIRGRNSIRSDGNDPLYIIDGVPYPSTPLSSINASQLLDGGNPLSSIDPQNIESIEILKDADATAIYGSRGANGVVLITTKRGKTGKTEVCIDAYTGIGKVPHMMDLLTTAQYLEMRNEAFANDGLISGASDHDLNGNWNQNRYTDWQKELIGGTAQTTSAQAAISGGNSNTQFLFRGRYYKETTVFPGDMGFQRSSGMLRVNHTSENRKFNAVFSTDVSLQKSDLINTDLTGQAVQLAPNAPALFNEAGELNWENSTWTNPLSNLERKYNGNTINLVTSAKLSYELFRGIQLQTNAGYNNIRVRETRITPLSALNPAFRAGRTGSTVFSERLVRTWIVEPQIQYREKIGTGVLNILVGATFQESVQEGEALLASGYTDDALLLNKQAATDFRILSSDYTQYRYNAIYGRLNFNWKEKYILNITGRRDGSTRFGPGKQFGNFGAIGAAWVFSSESFLRNSRPFLSFGKLRASYGLTGSDNIGDYQFLNSYSTTTYPYGGVSGLLVTRLPNDDFSWETVKKLEVGLELGLINDRVFFEMSWYRNRSTDQLVGLPLPVISGQSTVQANLSATVENRGWEFSLNASGIQTENLAWTTGINLTIPQNKLMDYPDLESSPFANRYSIGKSLFIQPTYRFTGVDPQTGVSTFEDINGDGNISFPADIRFLKEINQSFFGGLQNTINYKGLELDFLFQFVKQTGFTHGRGFGPLVGRMSNQPVVILGRWQRPGDRTDIQQFTQTYGSEAGRYFNTGRRDDEIGDISFIRLKNISLSYRFPTNVTDQLGFEGLKLYVQGQNLLTITNYIGLDPENQSISSLPPLRTIISGIQITF